jgi:hypothetical protein
MMKIQYIGGPNDGDSIEGGSHPEARIEIPILNLGDNHPPHVYLLVPAQHGHARPRYVHQRLTSKRADAE